MAEIDDVVDGGDMADQFLIYFAMAMLTFAFSFVVFWMAKFFGSGPDEESEVVPEPVDRHGRVIRRGLGAAHWRQVRRNRLRTAGANIDSDDGGDDDGGDAVAQYSDEELNEKLKDPTLGAKKRAKLEAKAEKRAQREAEERMREDRKKKLAEEQKQRELHDREEAEAEKRREEEEKRRREEQAQADHEEYMKMKEMFTVDEEGCVVLEEENEGNLIEKFIDHIKDKKVILFEELASQFGLKVPEAINRLMTLVHEGRLTGVMDDRGKFIYISEEELQKFAKFIKQRGRVSIADLVENSASLITLTSETQEVSAAS